jgi:hypothetical protein
MVVVAVDIPDHRITIVLYEPEVHEIRRAFCCSIKTQEVIAKLGLGDTRYYFRQPWSKEYKAWEYTRAGTGSTPVFKASKKNPRARLTKIHEVGPLYALIPWEGDFPGDIKL